jgi:OmpR family two-component system bacitracin resistance sensor histidine kinase BceS
MLKKFLNSRKSWILLFLVFILLTNFVILTDAGIQLQITSLIYLNVLLISLVIGFTVWRYRIETAYIRYLLILSKNYPDDWMSDIPEPDTLTMDHTVYGLLQAIQSYHIKSAVQSINDHKMEENALVSWVHDIKSPLTAMKLTLDSNPSNPLTHKIEPSWLQINMLVDRQLYISRMSDLENDLISENIDIKQLVREEIKSLSTWFREKNLSVTILSDETQQVITDRKWCGFIIRQLLSNAVKYSPENEEINILIGHTDADSTCLTIKDNGPGIRSHDLPRIFDKGFTGDNGRVQQSSTGIGLYLAHNIAETLHHNIIVESNEDKGTSASIIFEGENAFNTLKRTDSF